MRRPFDGCRRGADPSGTRAAVAAVDVACDTLPHRINAYAYNVGRVALSAVLDRRGTYADSGEMAAAVDNALARVYDAVRTSHDSAYVADTAARADSLEFARSAALEDIQAADGEGSVWSEDVGYDARDRAGPEARRAALADAFPAVFARDGVIAEAYADAIDFSRSHAGMAYSLVSEGGIRAARERGESADRFLAGTLDAFSALEVAHQASGADYGLGRTLWSAQSALDAITGSGIDHAVCHAAVAHAGALAGDDDRGALEGAAEAAVAAAAMARSPRR